MEEYRQIEGYDNYYVINLGNVRNNKRGSILNGSLNSDGYYKFVYLKKEKRKLIQFTDWLDLSF